MDLDSLDPNPRRLKIRVKGLGPQELPLQLGVSHLYPNPSFGSRVLDSKSFYSGTKLGSPSMDLDLSCRIRTRVEYAAPVSESELRVKGLGPE
ncbi:hypothetical protein SAY87_010649 [Trapa incisa]|uniref:Uncharacterized protein n=1 Tax=Trapa incisa TaxID=236973 RepID=A0AAN7JI62_9MYRT|nr:hypothetical protein SAY87_010649 [Trapa incisa]